MRQSRKANASELFSQGYTPLSQEVKTLGLHTTNHYKYFSEQKRLGKPARYTPGEGQVSALSSPSSSGETIGGIDETIATKSKDQEKPPINS